MATNKKTTKPAKKLQSAQIEQEAQEVQEVTTGDKPDSKADFAFDMGRASFFIGRAAEYYGKPIEETTLQDAFNKMDLSESGENADPEFIKKCQQEMLEAAKSVTGKEAAEDITGADVQAFMDTLPPLLSDDELDYMTKKIDMAKGYQQFAATVAATVSTIAKSPEFKAATDIIKATTAFMASFAEHSDEISEKLNKSKDFTENIVPFIVLEIADRTGEKDIPKLSFDKIRQLVDASAAKAEEDKTPFEKQIDHILDAYEFDGTPGGEKAQELLEAALKRKAAHEDGKEVLGAIESIAETITSNATDKEKAAVLQRDLPIVFSHAPANLIKATDKISRDITTPYTKDKLLLNGQQTFAMIKTSSGQAVPVTLTVNFSNDVLKAAGIKKEITPYDIMLQQAIHTLWRTYYDEGNTGILYTTPNKIWAQMGGKTKLNKTQKTALDKAIQKNATTWTEIDASRLLMQYTADGEKTGKEVKIKDTYKGTFLNVRVRERGIVDGKEQNCVIAILADPLLPQFADELGQITSIPLYVIQATGTINDDNLAIANYLQHEIAYMKHGGRNYTINLANLKETTGTVKRDNNLKKYIEELLKEYSNPPQGEKPFIDGFTKVKTGYKITINKPIKGNIPAKKSGRTKGKP